MATDKQRKGEFYTPKILADKAHEIISNEFNENWKEECIVWDCASGKLNLTRDYAFKDLFCSTLEQRDIDISNEYNYNPEATKFQFDFLNDKIDKLPQELLNHLNNNKPIIFFINPPFATSAINSRIGDEKIGVAKSEVNKLMRVNKIGLASRQLYTQFLYRILEIKKQFNLTNINIALFSPHSFITANSYKNFYNIFSSHFNFRQGILFNAGIFEDVAKSKWSIAFTTWSSSKPKNELILNIVEKNNKTNILHAIEQKLLKSITNHLGEWIPKSFENLVDAPQMSSALIIKETGKGKWDKESLGFFFCGTNNVGTSEHNIGLFSSPYHNAQGYSITKENFQKVMMAFTARKVIQVTPYNCFDEFNSPDETHLKYQQFMNDALVYAIFETKSNQTSIRKVLYKGKYWDIKNEFFWLSKKQMIDLAEEHGFYELSIDASMDSSIGEERYLHTLLQNTILSPKAQEILDMGTKLLIDSFKFRQEFHEKHPEYHLSSWDCGWAQLKILLKEYLPKETKEFRIKYQDFRKYLEPITYELGFL